MSGRPRSRSADACAASEHDPEAQVGRVPPLFAQEEPAHGEAAKPRHLQDARRREAPRARRAVLQASLTEPPGPQRPGSSSTPRGRRGLAITERVGTRQHERVGDQVRRQRRRAEQDLHAAREARRVEHEKEVALDEASGVARRAALRAQPVLERSQGAHPPGPFHEDSPDGRGELDPCDARPAQDQEASHDDQEDEAAVDHDHCVGKESVEHRSILVRRFPGRATGHGVSPRAFSGHAWTLRVFWGLMSISRTARLSMALLAVAGCASKYAPTQRMASIQASLDRPQAARIFTKALTRSPTASGLCKASFSWDDPKPAATAEAFTVQAWRRGEEVGRKEVTGICVDASARGQAAITLHMGRVEVPIILAVDDVDTVLAALAVLAPQATFIEGAGL